MVTVLYFHTFPYFIPTNRFFVVVFAGWEVLVTTPRCESWPDDAKREAAGEFATYLSLPSRERKWKDSLLPSEMKCGHPWNVAVCAQRPGLAHQMLGLLVSSGCCYFFQQDSFLAYEFP